MYKRKKKKIIRNIYSVLWKLPNLSEKVAVPISVPYEGVPEFLSYKFDINISDIKSYNLLAGKVIPADYFKNHQTYERLAIFKIEEVLPFVGNYDKEYLGKLVHMNSLRYITFIQSGLRCVKCGIEGKFFALEKKINGNNPDRYHFNLYALDDNNNEILMTKDHIIPVSKGGRNNPKNLQTMCIRCNVKKGSSQDLNLGVK